MFFSYAETHYRPFNFPSLYFQKLPEIIFDLPSRLIKKDSQKLPILLIIKDSHTFPIKLKDITIYIHHNKGILKKNIILNINLSQNYFSKIFYLEMNKIETDQTIITTKILPINHSKLT